MQNLSSTLFPLNQLLRKDVEWNWSKDCGRAFEKVKKLLTGDLILANFDPNENHTLITDASPTGLGAVLCQGKDEKPVMYVSRSLAVHERKYSQIEREGLCIIFAFERLRHFLLGKRFKLVTDNKSLSSIVAAKLPALAASRVQRWMLKLAEFDFDVEVRRS